MSISVVIGAAYGDEGKGATVNKLANKDSVVVRFNGGCQAGHTVEHNGNRHVFSHIGSGSLKGASTYLSSHFVCSPLAFYNEYQALKDIGVSPDVNISKDCLITTPWDVLINQALEEKRGDERHGSVGVGFNETIERCNNPQYRTTVRDIFERTIGNKIKNILHRWIPQRTSSLGIKIPNYWEIDTFLYYCDAFYDTVDPIEFEQIFLQQVILNNNVIFEGAQGLMLDQSYGTFPYVTRSNCGLRNVVSLIPKEQLSVYYVTRAYTTRHGNGPFPFELSCRPYHGIVDATNVPNQYQGGLRFSFLNLDTLKEAIDFDLQNSLGQGIVYGHMTCLDQLPKHNINAVYHNRHMVVDRDKLYDLYCSTVGLHRCELDDKKMAVV